MSEKNITDIVPEGFWALIEGANQDTKRFREMLKTMNREQINHFYWTYEELANRIRAERYSPYVAPGLSEDGLAELANWVVAQGKAYYRKILDHPELIPPKKNDAGLLSEVVKEYEQRFKGDVPPNMHEWDNEWKQHGKKSPWA
ncbi:DUF4240 domain-containing protein [Methylocapsa polymorpha]|uniref:DUF4240 domain-containing protein n=1 Tax=Methylocapsa polymorpha TaxID=3080828 RepID=A0ABZ0HT12_9HYPH|nr:DUF4240 domain-containing protein [Methylocapsa sp. RX1]